MSELQVRGVGLSADEQRALIAHFSRPLGDDDVRLVHDLLRDGLCRGDAYRGAREDMEIWKKRALEAEATIRRMCAEFNTENGPMHMGEPILKAHPPLAPSVPAGYALVPIEPTKQHCFNAAFNLCSEFGEEFVRNNERVEADWLKHFVEQPNSLK